VSDLDGKVALVTGASRGIGLEVAKALEDAGAHVARLARSLKDSTGHGRSDYRCDVTDPAQVAAVTGRVVATHGVPHIVVNNAGRFVIHPLAETTPEDFAATIAVNLTGCFLVARILVPKMVEAGRGHLVTIGSISDYRTFPGNAAYAASKWGLRGMHEVMVAELVGSPVRTTLVSPGPVDTDLWDPIDPDRRAGFTKRADMLKAEDVADAVRYAVTRTARVDVTEIRLLPAVYRPRT
jgi:NADP-dependent 3-hydroxy acid dehydrogenase YdfG